MQARLLTILHILSLLAAATCAGDMILGKYGSVQYQKHAWPRKISLATTDEHSSTAPTDSTAFLHPHGSLAESFLLRRRCRDNVCRVRIYAGMTSFRKWISKFNTPWQKDGAEKPEISSLFPPSRVPPTQGKESRQNGSAKGFKGAEAVSDTNVEEKYGLFVRSAGPEDEEAGPGSNFSSALWTCERTTFSFLYDNEESHLILEGDVLVTPLGDVSTSLVQCSGSNVFFSCRCSTRLARMCEESHTIHAARNACEELGKSTLTRTRDARI